MRTFYFSIFLFFLFALNLFWSRNSAQYKSSFINAIDLSFSERFIQGSGHLREFGFYAIQNISVDFIPYAIYLFLIIFLSLGLKYIALLQLNPKPIFLDVYPYILLLAFLHEGTQIRIALAISFVLLSVILWSGGNLRLSATLLFAAVFFHNSVLIYCVPLLLLTLFPNKTKFIFLSLATLGVMLIALPKDFLLQVSMLVFPRYVGYFSERYLLTQNSSGLFQYYFLFVCLLSFFIWKYFNPESVVWKNLKNISILCAILAILILQSLSFSVIIASRFADALLLPIALVLGATLTQLYQARRYLPLIAMSLVLLVYGLIRGYISFRPLINPVI